MREDPSIGRYLGGWVGGYISLRVRDQLAHLMGLVLLLHPFEIADAGKDGDAKLSY